MPDIEEQLIENILDNLDYTLSLGFSKRPSQGQIVVTGYQFGAPKKRRLGYCVQIRVGRGQFGSDMVFLRHLDGGLVTHENQCFYGLTPEQEALVRPLFKGMIEEEDYTHGYLCCGKVMEVGFLIENSKSEPMPNTPFSVTITNGAGGVQRTDFV